MKQTVTEPAGWCDDFGSQWSGHFGDGSGTGEMDVSKDLFAQTAYLSYL